MCLQTSTTNKKLFRKHHKKREEFAREREHKSYDYVMILLVILSFSILMILIFYTVLIPVFVKENNSSDNRFYMGCVMGCTKAHFWEECREDVCILRGNHTITDEEHDCISGCLSGWINPIKLEEGDILIIKIG